MAFERTDRRRPEEQRGHLWHVCPQFVIESRSPADRPQRLAKKMEEWLEAGAELGWLIDPETRTVAIYRPGQAPELVIAPATLDGEGPLAGFRLDLAPVWG